MARKKRAIAKRLFEFADVLEGRRLIKVTVGPTLCPVLLSLPQQPDAARSQALPYPPPGWPGLGKPRPHPHERELLLRPTAPWRTVAAGAWVGRRRSGQCPRS